MRFGRLILILMAALLVQQAQCLAACAVETCQQNTPPCHRHHGEHSGNPSQDHSTLCLHNAAAPNLSLLAMSAAPAAVASFQSSSPSSLATRRTRPLIAASPPGPAIITLRI
jgi:hypothetical protein